MPITLENVGIAVRDLDAAIAFFTDLGLHVLGRDEISGEWADVAVGLDGNHARIAVLATPDGRGQIELFEYLHPTAIDTAPTLPNEIGMHRVAFRVDDIDASLAIAARHGCVPLRGVAEYEGIYRLTYLRGPSGILVMLAQDLRAGDTDARTADPAPSAPARPGAIDHLELRVADLDAAQEPWGWLLGELGYTPYQSWAEGCSWRSGDGYVVLEAAPGTGAHDRRQPGLSHVAFHAGDRAAVERLWHAAPDHGWRQLYADRWPWAGGEGHFAAFLEDGERFKVELVASDPDEA